MKLSRSSKEPQRKPDLAYFERNHPIFKLLVVAMKYLAIVVIAVFGPAKAAELLRLVVGA